MDFKQKVVLYKTLFSSETGKEVLGDLERQCYLGISSYDDNALTMAFREGRRSVVLDIKRLLNTEFKEETEAE